jgi:tetratricopeptide (TPR) repeat protein
MGFRFQKRIRLFPGVTLNLSKSGGSLSLGPRGAKLNLGPRGASGSVGLPGSGAYYTKKIWRPGSKKKRGSAPAVRKQDRLTMGFFKRLVTPKHEEDFVDGLKALHLGDELTALQHFLNAAKHPDPALMAGFILLRQKKLPEAIEQLTFAAKGGNELGTLFHKYDTDPHISIAINEEFSVHAGANPRAAMLGLVEAYQELDQLDEARTVLKGLLDLNPEDPVTRLSLAELLFDGAEENPEHIKEVVRLTQGTENDSEPEACLMLYQARALRKLGLADEAKTVLTSALRKTKDRSPELLKALRYERILAYEDLGDNSSAKKDTARLFAMDADYEDVADRLM